MADSIKIKLQEIFEPITDADIKKAKKWTLLREENAQKLGSLIEDILEDTARDLTKIAYRYNCRPEEWQFSENEKLREEVAKLMNETEDRILELVEEYSLNETNDKKKRSTLLPWLMALKSKGAKDLASTLHKRLQQFLFDTEAQIAAMKLASYNQAKAISRTLSTLHSVYTSPEMLAAFKKRSAAMYIKSRGVHYGNVGLSNSGATNVENFGKQTAAITWMKSQLMDFQDDGAVGYYQLRGSIYPCTICDEETGLHLGDILNDPYPHHHCMCYRVPVFKKDEIVKSENRERKSKYQKLKNDDDYIDVEYNPKNGGLKATHKDHNFDKTGGVYEKHVQNAGFKAGHAVIFGPEEGSTIGQRYTEGTWDGMRFEVAGRETGTENNIFRGLKHCASKRDTEIAVLDYPNGGFSLEVLNSAIRRYRGLESLNDGQYIKFKKIICVQNEKLIYEQNF